VNLESFANLDQSLRGEAERLASEFRGIFSKETVEQVVAESRRSFGDARITAHLPPLVYRFAKERLQATARLEAMLAKEHPVVLFVCVHNAGRSQMAAAFTRELSQGRVEVRSAGSLPASDINPTVVRAMQEVGIDLSQEYPKPIADEIVRDADVVITMGCGDACPVYPGKKYEDWELDDPAGQPLEDVRPIRDAIRARVERLLMELGVTVG
jgi:protein-tyrosine-phosphatase